MAKKITTKKPLSGNNRSKALNATKRKRKLNIQTMTINGIKVKLTAREARTIKKDSTKIPIKEVKPIVEEVKIEEKPVVKAEPKKAVAKKAPAKKTTTTTKKPATKTTAKKTTTKTATKTPAKKATTKTVAKKPAAKKTTATKKEDK